MFECCIYFNLATLNRKITKIWEDEFARLGLAPSHGYLMVAIVDNPQLSQQELSALLELDASTITRFVTTLERKGLIEKSAKGKGATLAVTAAGKREYKKIKQAIDRLYQAMESHFGAEAFAAFVGGLRRARQSLAED